MKSVFSLALIALLGASAAHAGSGVSYNLTDECTDAQWQEAISSAPGNSLEAVTGISYDGFTENVLNLCVDGNYIRPISGADFTWDHCPGPGGADQDVSCQIHWADPIQGTEYQCTYDEEMTCDWNSVYRVLPLTYAVQVVDLATDSDDFVCQKSYTIPACSKVEQAK